MLLQTGVDQNGRPQTIRPNENSPDSAIADLNSLLHVHGMDLGDALNNMQSNVYAERLLSIFVAKSLRQHGFETENRFVEIIAHWHEASDGRGLTQVQRYCFNYQMLNAILDKWSSIIS